MSHACVIRLFWLFLRANPLFCDIYGNSYPCDIWFRDLYCKSHACVIRLFLRANPLFSDIYGDSFTCDMCVRDLYCKSHVCVIKLFLRANPLFCDVYANSYTCDIWVRDIHDAWIRDLCVTELFLRAMNFFSDIYMMYEFVWHASSWLMWHISLLGCDSFFSDTCVT